MIANTWMSFGTNSTLQCDCLHFPSAAQWPQEHCAASSWTPPGVGMHGVDPGMGASPGSLVWGHPTTCTSSLQIPPASLPSPNKWVSVPDSKAQHPPLSRHARYYWMRTGMGVVISPTGTGLLLPPRGLGAVGREEEEGESSYCWYKPCTDILQTLGRKVVADNIKYAQYLGGAKIIWPVSGELWWNLHCHGSRRSAHMGGWEVGLSASVSPPLLGERELATFPPTAPALSVTVSQVQWHQILIWHTTWAVRMHFVTNSVSNPWDLMTITPLLSHCSVTLTQILSQFRGKNGASEDWLWQKCFKKWTEGRQGCDSSQKILP